MATAGSGDVLTGIITSLLAQGHSAENAVLFGVFIHGCAGDIAVEMRKTQALLAGDIVKAIGNAISLTRLQPDYFFD